MVAGRSLWTSTWTVRVRGAKPRWRQLKHGHAPTWSPDGKVIAYRPAGGSDRFGIGLMTPAGRRARLFEPTRHAWPIHFDWAPNGRRLVYTECLAYKPQSPECAQSVVRLIRVRARTCIGTMRPIVTGSGLGFAAVWSPDGKRIAYVRHTVFGSQIWSIRPDATRPRLMFTAPSQRISGLSWQARH